MMTIAQAVLWGSLSFVAAVPAAAQTPDVTGVWDMTFDTSQGATPAQLTVKKDGEKLTGTMVSPRGEIPVEIVMKERDVTMRFTYQSRNGPLPVVMTGTVIDDAMSGTADVDGREQVKWSGKRVAAQPKSGEKPADAKPDVSGTWNVSVATSSISANPTLVLKQDGEKLTGTYISQQYGEFALEGRVRDKAINFSFTMTIEGNPLLVTFGGTAEQDSMSGRVNYGDLVEGTFTAKRKQP